MLYLLLLAVATARAACDAPADIGTLSAAAPTAQLAMASLDSDGFAKAVADARDSLPCLAQPLTPLDAASYHGLMALAAFADGDEDAAQLSFAAAIVATPDFRLPAMIAPEGGDLDALLGYARALDTSETVALAPYDGVLLVDGSRAFLRPVHRPYILQLVGPRGDVRATYYLLGSDPVPAYDPPPTLGRRLLPEFRPRPSAPFAVAAGATALAAGGMYWLGAESHARYMDPTTPYGDLPGLQTRTNAELAGSIALGVTAVAFTTLTFVRW